METLIQWDLFAQGGLQLATDDNLAGNGALFLLLGDIATRAKGCGILASRLATISKAPILLWRRCATPTTIRSP